MERWGTELETVDLGYIVNIEGAASVIENSAVQLFSVLKHLKYTDASREHRAA